MKTIIARTLKMVAGILLATNVSFACMGQGVEITNEYWIEPSTNGLNLGTLDNPFWGNNQATFDFVMSNLVTRGNVVVHLVTGTYQTAGPYGYLIGPSTTIIGSGMDATIVHFALTGKAIEGVWQANQDHITIQDLTIDCNGSNNILSFGPNLGGNFETVKRVKVVNAIGNAYESFGIAVGSFGTHDLVIEDCVVTNCLGTYGDAFTATGGNSCVLNCRAYLPVGSWAGINCAGFHDAKIIGNHVDGGIVAFYMDTAPGDGILLQGNTFNRQNEGIQFNNGSVLTNILIIGNIIHLGTNVATFPNHGICFSGSTNVYSVQISHNIVVGNNTGRGDDSLNIEGIKGGIVSANSLDNRLAINVWNSTNVWMFDNVDQYGNYAAFTAGSQHQMPVGLSNPVNRIETTANYTASLNDYYIGALCINGVVTITLPNAQTAGSGKTYVIQSENPIKVNVIVSAYPQTINGNYYFVLTNAFQGCSVVSDGNSKWYAH